jgi:hypothetical protein
VGDERPPLAVDFELLLAVQMLGYPQLLHADGAVGVEVAGVAAGEVLGVVGGVWGRLVGHAERVAECGKRRKQLKIRDAGDSPDNSGRIS